MVNEHVINRSDPDGKTLIIAVDFDGCLVEEAPYPDWGPLMPYAREVLDALAEAGHTLILWSARGGIEVDRQRAYIEHHALPIHYVSRNVPELEERYLLSDRKIFADVYLDDRSFPPFTSWQAFAEAVLPAETCRRIFANAPRDRGRGRRDLNLDELEDPPTT